MNQRKTANTIILWVVSIGLLVSMVIAFTPTLGLGRGGNNVNPETVATVNGREITELDIARAQQQSPLGRITDGEVGEDISTLIIDNLINQELFAEEASRIRVSNAEVRTAVAEYRENSGVAGRSNEVAYLNALRNQGFTDATFREFLRERERQQKFTDSLLEGVEATDTQVRDYFESNRDAYLSEPEIVGRYIVLDDETLANELRLRLNNPDEDFATLASEYSIEKADQGGALAGTNDEVLPVQRLALPSSVADAAFALTDGGITDVVASGGLFYITQVSLYVTPDQLPFEEVENDVRETVQNLVEGAVLEEKLDTLRTNANIVIADNETYTYKNDPVATVGEHEILRTDLANALYSNPSIQNFLSPGSVDLISFFKPQILEQLINNELAYQGASQLEGDFFGTRDAIAQAALNHVSKDVTIDDEEVRQYYLDNQATYTNPAEATQTQQFIAAGRDSVESLRLALLDGDISLDDITTHAEAYQVSVTDLGSITRADLTYNLQEAVFGADSKGVDTDMTLLPNSSISASPIVPLSADESNFTFVVGSVVPESLRPFERVRSSVEEVVLNDKKQVAQTNWLDELRTTIDVKDLTPSAAIDRSTTVTTTPAEPVATEPSFTTAPFTGDTPVELEAPVELETPAETSVETSNTEISTETSTVSDDTSDVGTTTEPTDGNDDAATSDEARTEAIEPTTDDNATPENGASIQGTESSNETPESLELTTTPDNGETSTTSETTTSVDSPSTITTPETTTSETRTPAVTNVETATPTATSNTNTVPTDTTTVEGDVTNAISNITTQIQNTSETVDSTTNLSTEAATEVEAVAAVEEEETSSVSTNDTNEDNSSTTGFAIRTDSPQPDAVNEVPTSESSEISTSETETQTPSTFNIDTSGVNTPDNTTSDN